MTGSVQKTIRHVLESLAPAILLSVDGPSRGPSLVPAGEGCRCECTACPLLRGRQQGRKYPSRSASWRSEGLEVSALVISYRHLPRRCVGWQFKREEKKYDGEGYC